MSDNVLFIKTHTDRHMWNHSKSDLRLSAGNCSLVSFQAWAAFQKHPAELQEAVLLSLTACHEDATVDQIVRYQASSVLKKELSKSSLRTPCLWTVKIATKLYCD